VPEYAFKVETPLGFEVHCTVAYWSFISEVKHPVLAGKMDRVLAALGEPAEIRRSLKDPEVFLFYGEERPRWMCAVSRREGATGFLVTAYPTDSMKIGETVWRKSR